MKYELDPGPGVNGSSATDSEYRAVGVNGAFSSYYYDAKHRRREKVYPAGARDEFYYLAGSEMIAQTVTPASGGTSYSRTWGGCTMGNYWFPWLPMVSNSAKVSMVTSTGTVIAQGMTVDAYEYRRAATGMQPFWTPMRYPGQYKDDETGLFQNWNRFYDPDGERMLSPEPMWQTTKPILTTAKTGVEWPVYGYAANNSLNSVDPNGLYPMDSPSWDRLAESQLAIDRAAANGDPASQVMVGSAFAVTGVAAVATGALAYDAAGSALFWAGVRYPLVGSMIGMGVGSNGGVCSQAPAKYRPGRLEAILSSIQRNYQAANPTNQMGALCVVDQSTTEIGLVNGVGEFDAAGNLVLKNAGNVLTTIGTDGSIVVTQGGQTLLGLPK